MAKKKAAPKQDFDPNDPRRGNRFSPSEAGGIVLYDEHGKPSKEQLKDRMERAKRKGKS